MRISDWSSDVCSSDLALHRRIALVLFRAARHREEAPELFAGDLIVGGDEAACAEVGAGIADDDLAGEHARRAGADIEHFRRNGPGYPLHRAAFCVGRDQATFQRPSETPAGGEK